MPQETSQSSRMGHRVLRLLFNFRKNGGLPFLFIVLLFLPLADMGLRIDRPWPIKEKRKLAAQPRFHWEKPWEYLRAYEAYFNDHFGFRNRLVHWHNLIQVAVFNTSPVPKVLIGRNNWLFLNHETKTRNEVEYFRALKPFRPAALEHWRKILRQRWLWLKHRNITYFFMVVPNKSTIYPEYMPTHIRKVRPQNRLDQLLAVLEEEPGFPVIDLRETLRREKKRFLLYHRTDSHWTDPGAYFAYRQVMKNLAAVFPGARAFPLDRFTFERRDRTNSDLALMLSLQEGRFKEQEIKMQLKPPVPMATSSPKRKLGPYTRMNVSECPEAPLPTVLIVHDSFMHHLKPFFMPHFKRIVYIWDWGLHFFTGVIEREKPVVVIDQITERMLCNVVVNNPPELNPGSTH